MGNSGPGLIVFFFATVVVVILVVGVLQAAKRRQAWQELAGRLGCSFSAKDPLGVQESYPQTLFGRGRRRKAYNVLNGQVEGNEIACFDYRYTQGSGENQRTHYFTCLLLTSPIAFQPFSIRPESLFDRVGEFFGLDDIDFESDEFSRRFFVKCPDKKFAYDIIHARTMELLLECGNIYVEARGDSILLYYSGKLRVPGDVEPFIQRGLRLLDLIPNYLIEQAKGANR